MIKIKKYKYPIILSILSFSIMLSFQHCGKGSGEVSSISTLSSNLQDDQDCEMGSTCNGGIYIGDYMDKKVTVTLGSCSKPDPISCLGIVEQSEVRNHCENMVYGGYSDWTVALAEEVTMMLNNKIAPDNMLTSYLIIGGGVSPAISGTGVVAYAPFVGGGSRVLCARRRLKLSPPSPTPVSPETISNTQIQSLKTSTSCLNGRSRLTKDVSFHVGTNLVKSTGAIVSLYVGISSYHDLMFVTPILNGAQITGYNVTLSFCEVPNAYPNYPALISDDRPLINFQAPNGIVLNTDTSCSSYGVISAATNTIIISQRSATIPYTSDFVLYSSFAKPNCNENL